VTASWLYQQLANFTCKTELEIKAKANKSVRNFNIFSLSHYKTFIQTFLETQ